MGYIVIIGTIFFNCNFISSLMTTFFGWGIILGLRRQYGIGILLMWFEFLFIYLFIVEVIGVVLLGISLIYRECYIVDVNGR